MIIEEEATYALIGYPVGHSFSAGYFNKKFEEEKLDERYVAIQIPRISLFPSILNEYRHLKGINVTSPWKQDIIPFLDEISEDAKKIDAVNTIKITRIKGALHLSGHNTDIYGFRESLKKVVREDISSALIFGTGGASNAVAEALSQLGIKYMRVSRSSDNALNYADLSTELVAQSKLLINATPLGMGQNTSKCVPIPYDAISTKHICYDLIYNPAQTEFLKRGMEKGATVINGLEMLHLQAQQSWRIWNEE
ncbi:MAG: shikimate dehydrogenase [Prevotella sp.]|nr:shikimate dehydrogenase [Bacteroides sp.]MCM1365778.1 shikimate dehydrogenase [Prevotella sp.]MCM1436530.1 shikimate dehydrogenase [Prevotella sp.]